jgi:hypothetical protein
MSAEVSNNPKSKYMTKIVFVFTICVTLATAAFAANQNQHKKKNQGQGQGQGQAHVQGKGKGKGKGQGHAQGQKFKGQGKGHAHVQGQGKGKGQGQKFKGQGHVQGQGKGKGKGQGQAQGQKFHGNKQQVQANKKVYKAKHFNLSNKPNPHYTAVKFSKNYKIQGAHNWKGQKYVVFRNYNPVWHNQIWWTNHYNRTVFVFGGWYYWNAGYWFPAWGYDPGSVYYYNGPIYASNPSMDPGQVVANVQSALQDQGYYKGEVDGILGPQTRAALAEYQQANGLEPTAAVDEPTLDSLGMS